MKWMVYTITGAALAAALSYIPVGAQVHGRDDHHSSVSNEQTTPEPQPQQMMAAMKAADARLEGLVAEMNAATGDRKITAMAALLTALVSDRRMMNATMKTHMSSMMEMMNRTDHEMQIMNKMDMMKMKDGAGEAAPAPEATK